MIQSFLKTSDAKAAKLQIRAGIEFMNLHGLKRLPIADFVLVRENGQVNVLKEIVSRQIIRRPALGFVSVNVEKKVKNCGKVIL